MSLGGKCMRYSKFLYGFMILFACYIPLTLCTNRSEEANLIREKMEGYNRKLRPVHNISKAVDVYVAFDLQAIKEFDEVHESISIVGFFRLVWKDEFMTWDPNKFSGINNTMIDAGDVWTPTLVLVNPVEEIGKVENRWSQIRFLADGNAIYNPGDVFTAICKMDTTFYPWDVQTCMFTFLAWGYSSSEIQLHAPLNKALLNYYTVNGEWELTEATCTLSDFTEKVIWFGREHDFHGQKFILNINLTRRSKFVLVNVILPIVFMSFLNVLAFLIPTVSGERLSYCITVLLAQAVFLTIVGDNLPKTSDPMSILSFYLLAVLIISVSITVSVILSMAVYFREERYPVPRCLSKFAELCVGEKENEQMASEIEVQNEDNTMHMDNKKGQGFTPVSIEHHNENTEETCSVSDIDRSYTHLIRKSNTNTIAEEGNCSFSKTPAYIRSARAREYPISWKDVSIVIDRVLFVVFLLSTVGCMLWVMVRIIQNKQDGGVQDFRQ